MKQANRIKVVKPIRDTVPPEVRVPSDRLGLAQAKPSPRKSRAGKQASRLVASTTPDRSEASDEQELTTAMKDYQKSSGRMFPTWSEVLEVLQGLGYQKRP